MTKTIICNDNELTDDLIAVTPFVDAGYILTMEKSKGSIHNEENGITIPVIRRGTKWLVNLQDIKSVKSIADDNKVSCLAVSLTESVLHLHERLGHPSTESMCKAIESGIWQNSGFTATQVRRIMLSEPCVACILAKKNKPSIEPSNSNRDRLLQIGEFISGDIVGKISPPAKTGEVYYFLFSDRKTGYLRAYTSKSKESFATALEDTIQFYSKYGHTVKYFRSDSEVIMLQGEVLRLMTKYGIKPEHSLPYAHHQNPVERHVQTMNKLIATNLHSQTYLSSQFWDHALFHSLELRNHTPNSKTGQLSPSQLVIKEEGLDLQRQCLFPFGAIVVVSVVDPAWKFDLKNDLAIYLGHPQGTANGGLVYYPFSGKVCERANITAAKIPGEAFVRYFAARYELSQKSVAGTVSALFDNLVLEDDTEGTATRFRVPMMDRDEIPREPEPPPRVSDLTPRPLEEQAETPPAEVPPGYPPDLKLPPLVYKFPLKDLPPSLVKKLVSKHVKKYNKQQKRPYLRKKAETTDRVLRERSQRKLSALVASLSQISVNEAVNSAEGAEWISAIKAEVESLLYRTKTLIPETPETGADHDVIYATMVLKKKMIDAITIGKYKARCCACGNQLTSKGTYVNETFSPTASQLVHSTMLQLSIHDRLHMSTFDTVAAYLYQIYPDSLKPLYLKLPKNVATLCGLDPTTSYRVKKYLYGLPDAGRAYYLAYREHLILSGYSATDSDPCLFVRLVPDGGIRTYVWFHVDDTFVSSTHSEEILRFRECLVSKFDITFNEQATSHLGVDLISMPSGNIKLQQQKLLDAIFEEFTPSGNKVRHPHKTPKRKNDHDEMKQTRVNPKEYLHLLGMLMYVTHSRPDIASALSYAATKSSDPTTTDFESLLEIVDYLWSTRDRGLIMHASDGENQDLQLICHVDASYLSHSDARSHTGYCLSFGHIGSFYSKSIKQKLVTTSSTHAEIRALYTLVLDIIFVVNMCDEVGRPISLPAVVFEDNQPVIDLSKTLHGKITRCKHFLMLVSFVREQVENGLIELRKIRTEENMADILTKAVDGSDFETKALKLLGQIDGLSVTDYAYNQDVSAGALGEDMLKV